MKRPPVCYSGEYTSPVRCSYPSFCLNSIRGNNRRDPDSGKLHNRNYVDSSKMSMSRRTRKLKETISLLEKVHDLKERISLEKAFPWKSPEAKDQRRERKGEGRQSFTESRVTLTHTGPF